MFDYLPFYALMFDICSSLLAGGSIGRIYSKCKVKNFKKGGYEDYIVSPITIALPRIIPANRWQGVTANYYTLDPKSLTKVRILFHFFITIIFLWCIKAATNILPGIYTHQAKRAQD